nr:hypothetical protein [uncultured Flavobacterium sp.]
MRMTDKEYIDRNMLGFEGDSIMLEKCKSIVLDNKIDTIIETGTFLGGTTRVMSSWAKNVHTIEINKPNYDKSKVNLQGYDNVNLIFGNSAEELDKLLSQHFVRRTVKFNGRKVPKVFFFLDAHFWDYNPLLDELKVISKYELNPFIAIHDFKVPNHPELGFDSYKGQDYDFDWIKKSVELVYGTEYKVEYNSDAEGAKRGCIYLSSK